MSLNMLRLLTPLVLATAVGWSAPETVEAWSFEEGLEGWTTLDKQAELSRCTDAAHVYQGQGSLQLSFEQRPVVENPQGEAPDLA